MKPAAAKKPKPPVYEPRHNVKRNITRFAVHFFVWIGAAVLFYVGFSFFFDTPLEHRMKQSTAELRRQYVELSARFDSLEPVLDNIVERDRNVFRTLFEAEPYDLLVDGEAEKWQNYEKLLSKGTRDLSIELGSRTSALETRTTQILRAYERLASKVMELGEDINRIPAIQPVINPDLTLLTASYGLRIHPFYKTLTSHQGVDFTVPEGSSVFATADGRVKDVIRRTSTSGLTVVLSHGNGYETMYSHLGKINVKVGDIVRRGDIIALSGNTGLSLAPHLHYEVRHNGLRIDPVHYFFMELTPAQYQKMFRIARSGMQSFD